MRVASDDGQALIQELEQKRGGKITARTFSLFYGDDNGRVIETGVFVYKIGNVFWMEDFEKVPSIFGIRIREPKNYRYEKFERAINADSIKSVDTVTKKNAVDFIENRTNTIKKAGKLAAIFGEPLLMLTLEDGRKVFLQVLDNIFFKS